MKIEIPDDVAAIFRDGEFSLSMSNCYVQLRSNTDAEDNKIYDWLESIPQQAGDTLSPKPGKWRVWYEIPPTRGVLSTEVSAGSEDEAKALFFAMWEGSAWPVVRQVVKDGCNGDY